MAASSRTLKCSHIYSKRDYAGCTAGPPRSPHLRLQLPSTSSSPATPATHWRGRSPLLGPRATVGSAVTAPSAVLDAPGQDAGGGPSAAASSGACPDHAAHRGQPFVWTSHWWPLFPEACLRPDRPNPVTLLGVPLVAWRDGGGGWRVFRDACPHRMAPLSEGRVESDGSLSCSYHGWRFAGSGACSRIPQALDPGAEAAACGSRRACATAYPARVEAGMLWVWPDDSPDAAAAAAATLPQLTANTRARASTTAAAAAGSSSRPVTWFVRELPYSYEVLVENLLDPAHLPFSHHGVAPPLKRSLGGPMPMRAAKAAAATSAAAATTTGTAAAAASAAAGVGDAASAATAASAAATAAAAPCTGSTAAPAQPQPRTSTSSGAGGGALPGPSAHSAGSQPTPPPPPPPGYWARPGGPDVELVFRGNISPDATITFTGPHLVTYTYRLPGGSEVNIELYATPIAPGRSRFFSPDPGPPPPGARRPPLPPLHKMGLLRVLNLMLMIADPVVSSHRSLNTILDGDGVFLHVQDQLVRQLEAEMDAQPQEEAAQTERGQPDDGADVPQASPSYRSSDGSDDGGVGSSTGKKASGGSAWSRAYILPTQADTAVLAARRWLEERAGGGPFRARALRRLPMAAGAASAAEPRAGGSDGGASGGGGGVAPGGLHAAAATAAVLAAAGHGLVARGERVPGEALSPSERARALDRHEQHTRHCPVCTARLRQLRGLAAAAAAARTAALLGLCVAGGAIGATAAVQGWAAAAVWQGWPAALAAACAALAAAAAAVGRGVEAMARQFLFIDYVHAEKD